MTRTTRATPATRPVRAACLAASGAGAAVGVHLLLTLGAAMRARRRTPERPCHDIRLAVVIPAHDEELHIANAVASVAANDYPREHRRTIVVADNCTDRTATVAAAAGAEVWVRTDPERPGKGHALAWAFDKLLESPWAEAVCVLDADCSASANLLAALAARLRDGAAAAQAAYLISNPDASPAPALRWAAFALFNVIRPSGRDELGLSCGLGGTGMAISRALLARSPWASFSFAEDREQHMRWVLAGARVAFAAEAEVVSPAPETAADSRAQVTRWDSGRARLAARLTPRLLLRGVRERDPVLIDAALEPVLVPQTALLAATVLTLASARTVGARSATRLARATLLAQCSYVFGGLMLLRAPGSVWRSLPSAAPFVGRRVLIGAGSLLRGGPDAWQRTPRDRAAPPISADRDLVPGEHPTGDDFNWLAKRQIGNAIALAAQRHARGRLIDIGCGEKPYRELFAPLVSEHVGVDHPDSPHALQAVDVLASAYAIPLPDASFETALMTELLEHLETPGLALAEAFRLLEPGGRLILTTPFIWVIHEEPRDFFRYSPYALEWLLRQAGFESVEVTPVGGQWSTLGLLASYALRSSPLRWRVGDPGRRLARLAQDIGRRLDHRNYRPWMCWDHLAVATKPRSG